MTDREWDNEHERAANGYTHLEEAVLTANRLNAFGVTLCVVSNAHYQPDDSKRRYFLANANLLTSDTPQSSIVWK